MNDKPQILIVEDEAIVALDLQATCESFGYQVIGKFAQAEQSLEFLKDNRPDLILMDIMLAGKMTGITAAKKIREEYHLPVIFLTAHSDFSTLEEIKQAQPYGYLIKPYDANELQNVIEIALYKHNMEQQLAESEHRYRELVDLAGMAILTTGTDGKITYCNAHFCHLFGYAESALSGRALSMIVHPDDIQRVESIISASVNGVEHSPRFEYRGLHKDGSVKYVEVVCDLIQEDGVVHGTRSYHWDVSDRILAQQIAQKHALEMKSLYALTSELSAELELNKVMNSAIENAAELLSASAGFIYLNDPQTGELELTIESNHPDYTGLKIKQGQGLAGKVAETLQPMVISNYMDFEERLHEFDSIAIGAVAEVPMMYGGELVGVLGVQQTADSNKVFSKADLELLSLFAMHAAGAIKNAALYNSVKKQLSERKQAEKQLQESQTRFTNLVDTVDGIVWEFDLEANRFTYVSKKAERLLGYACDEWLNMDFCNKHMHEDDKTWVPELIQEKAREKKNHQFNLRMYSKDDKIVWLRNYVSAVAINHNGTLRGIMIDITEKVQTDELLKASEKRFRLVFENAPDAMVLADTENGLIVDANGKTLKMLGYSYDELIGKHFQSIHPPELKQQIAAVFKNHAETQPEKGFSKLVESEVLSKDGQVIPVEIVDQTIHINNRKLMLGIFRDISQRKKNEEELYRSREEYRGLFENAHDAILIIRPEDEQVLDVNHMACELYGFSRQEFMNLSLKQISQNVERGNEQVRTTVKNGIYKNFHTIQYRKDGSEMHLEINAAVVDYQDQKAILSINRDITNRVKVRKERDRLIEDLQNALSKVDTLRGLLPICAKCKKIRKDDGYWQQIEEYVSEHSGAEFSHGLCDDCANELFPHKHND